MNEPAKKITRQEFYQRVWTTPFVKLGKELGYSYLEMVRICARLKVPRPSGGYWYRLAHGGGPEQVPMPLAEPDVPTEIELGNPARCEKVTEPEEVAIAEAGTRAEAEPTKATRDEKQGAEGAPRLEAEPLVSREEKAAPPRKEKPTGKVVYTRLQLYEAVWSMPGSALAKALGLSGVGLAKTCKRLGIPRPTRGYWARVAAGQEVEKRRLPPAAEGQDRTLTFDVTANTARRDELAGAFHHGEVEEFADCLESLLLGLGAVVQEQVGNVVAALGTGPLEGIGHFARGPRSDAKEFLDHTVEASVDGGQ